MSRKKLHSVPHVSSQKKNLKFSSFIGPLFTMCKLKMRRTLSKLANEIPRCPDKTVGGDYLFTTRFVKVVIVLIAISLSTLFRKQKVNQCNAGRYTNFRKYNWCLCLQYTVMFHIQLDTTDWERKCILHVMIWWYYQQLWRNSRSNPSRFH